MAPSPYFKTHYPQEAQKISEGYADMGLAVTKFFKGIIKRFNPFRTP